MDIKLSNKKAFNDYLKQTAEEYFPLYIINELIKFGELFIKDARTNDSTLEKTKSYVNINGVDVDVSYDSPTYNNITTRLRNSIGYVVSRDSIVKHSNFTSYSVIGEKTSEGQALGLQYATEIASQTQGYALICVAGAEYAGAVEAKGYTVITASVLKLKQEILKKW